MSSQDNETLSKSQLQAEPGSDLALLRNNDDTLTHLTLFDSIIAAPLQIKGGKMHVPVYSDYLISRVVAVVVEEKTYHLHSSLLCQKSKKFERALTSGFQEEKELMIDLPEESPDLFAHFVEFLYMPGWKPICENSSNFICLPELYAMGERLLAQDFQDAVLRLFIDNITSYELENSQLCHLLTAACNNITERQYPKDDPMREYIFWVAALNLTDLQKCEDFRQLLITQVELGRQLALRAGNGTSARPSNPFELDDGLHVQSMLKKRKKKISGWG